MKLDSKTMRLYLVTDRSWLGENDLAVQVEDALRAGVSFVQLREKHLDRAAFLAEAYRIKTVTDRFGVPFVINDNVEIALECGADGVHIGQDDRSAREVRALLGPDKLLGVSTGTVEEALAAQSAGADYLGVGAVFSTSTKLDAGDVSFDTLREICAAVSIPVVAIGGISAKNILSLQGTGVDGVAVISAILGQPEIYAAAKELRALTERLAASC